MSTRATEERTTREDLRAENRGAFDEWALQMSHLQEAAGAQESGGETRGAGQRAALAETVYRSHRDRLMEHLELSGAKGGSQE